jgi:hypothetical protein
MKKRHARSGVARGNQAEHNNVAKPFCINSPNYATPEKSRQLPAWALSGAARSRTGKRPITLPRIAFLETGGDNE